MGKGTIIIFVTVGSGIGGYAPILFDNDNLFLSVITGVVGGIVGLWLGWKFINYIEE